MNQGLHAALLLDTKYLQPAGQFLNCPGLVIFFFLSEYHFSV